MVKPRHPLAYFGTESWDALLRIATAGRGPMRKGDRHTVESRARMAVARRVWHRARWARTLAALDRRVEARRQPRAARPGRIKHVERILAAMEPGAWYGVRDLVNTTGIPRKSVCAKIYQDMVGRGWVVRGRNPAWDGRWATRSDERRVVEPEFLWRLTAAGEAKRMALLGAIRLDLAEGDREPGAGNGE